MGESPIYEQGYNGRYTQPAPGDVTSGPELYGYTYGQNTLPNNPNGEPYGVNAEGFLVDQNGQLVLDQNGQPIESGAAQAGRAVPNAAPTQNRPSVPVSRPTAADLVRVIREPNARVQIQFRGNTAYANQVALALLDRNRNVVTESIQTSPPAIAFLTRYDTAKYAGVEVWYSNGTTRTYIVPLR
jgi:hypothetical protein